MAFIPVDKSVRHVLNVENKDSEGWIRYVIKDAKGNIILAGKRKGEREALVEELEKTVMYRLNHIEVNTKFLD